jgi:uncharacterized membrane protein HdeD (DUF308 family)
MSIKTRLEAVSAFWERHRIPKRAYHVGFILMMVGIAVIFKYPEAGMKVVMLGGTLAIVAACWMVCRWVNGLIILRKGEKNAKRDK